MDTTGGRDKDKPKNIALFGLINCTMIYLRYILLHLQYLGAHSVERLDGGE